MALVSGVDVFRQLNMKVGRRSSEYRIKVPIRLELVMPSPDRAWQEAIQLALVFNFMEAKTVNYIMQPILAGFKMNFVTEGSSGPGAWPQLADWTKSERYKLTVQQVLGFAGSSLVPGFTPEHPILQRTGEYMRSWTDSSHPLHGREDIGWNAAGRVIMEGSNDPRAEELSLGRGEPYPMRPRPVHIVGGLYETAMKAKIDAELARYAMTVQP